eukprot:SAG11_NODE_284_length_11240_cov_6.333812_2_plen_75_part_00
MMGEWLERQTCNGCVKTIPMDRFSTGRARESTAKFRRALALEFQLRKFCGAESECATGPHKRPVDPTKWLEETG